MHNTFTIKNFRCFEHFSVKDLRRVNLVGGSNDSGKTSLLEALWVHGAPNQPEISVRVNRFRGIQLAEPMDLWAWLFYERRIDDPIELRAFCHEPGSTAKHTILTIQLEVPQQVPLPTQGDEPLTIEGGLASLLASGTEIRLPVLRFVDFSNKEYESRVLLQGGEFYELRAAIPGLRTGVLFTAQQRLGPEDVIRFSKLEEENRLDNLLSVLQMVEPRLRRLTILSPGKAAILYCDVGLARLIPLQLLGEGIVRLTRLLLGMEAARGGIALIDEIENGLHYSVLGQVWKGIAEMARHLDVQVFASTHSWECVRAANTVFAAEQWDDLAYHRLDRRNGEINAITYDSTMLQTAIESGLELR